MDLPRPEMEPESYESALVEPARLPRAGLALPAAAGAALLGALLWAAVSYFANFEIGWIAWGIGAAAGAACVALGGRTQLHAFACAAIALAGIAGGKSLAIRLHMSAFESEVLSDQALQSSFEERREDARLWAELGADPSWEQVRSYMIERDFVGAGEVPDRASIDAFEAENGPQLMAHSDPALTLERWREHVRSELLGEYSFAEHFRATLTPFDLLWVVLGVGSAFGIVAKAAKEQMEAVRVAASAERRAARERRPKP
jgi:hypothetical protein